MYLQNARSGGTSKRLMTTRAGCILDRLHPPRKIRDLYVQTSQTAGSMRRTRRARWRPRGSADEFRIGSTECNAGEHNVACSVCRLPVVLLFGRIPQAQVVTGNAVDRARATVWSVRGWIRRCGSCILGCILLFVRENNAAILLGRDWSVCAYCLARYPTRMVSPRDSCGGFTRCLERLSTASKVCVGRSSPGSRLPAHRADVGATTVLCSIIPTVSVRVHFNLISMTSLEMLITSRRLPTVPDVKGFGTSC